MKKRLFIGSSAEQITTLNEIIALIGDAADCTPWTNAFGHNESTLGALIKQTRLSDFAILLATKDDITKQRTATLTTPRDNVIFEFGLFLGAASPDRCFLVAEEDADLPSDLDGVTVAKFSRKPGEYNSLDKIVESIKTQIIKISNLSELGLLPSTALAIGYYNSFIKRVCEEIHSNNSITIEEKEVKVKSFKINIVIPATLDDSGVGNFTMLYNKKHELKGASTFVAAHATSKRGYPFHFKVDPPDQDMANPIDIHISDIPGTLSTIVECLKLYLPTGLVGFNIDMAYLEKRELQNFTQVLKFLIERNVATNGFVEVETEAKLIN
ncbi:Predicted nucleotide-binding protein containing TIR-like domain-containing protein [Mucilaginibacter pineti]|uniref:CD-NTase-associated protein 12 n=1 Tax=Mucilaginibacter pineti TaxID=1391627 RepID=A0A1G7L349_9SPHI|nr:STING domain-containing protein [Mucilaginibacter pineti]SDF43918.1 Predicted nucleotide-binding protein containing TIR-like domain-containing protein [Mucilaginibacter pineti]